MHRWTTSLHREHLWITFRFRTCCIFLWNKKVFMVLSCLSLLLCFHVFANTLTPPESDSSYLKSQVYKLDSLTIRAGNKDFPDLPSDAIPSRSMETENRNKLFKIIILSYMRSGSTLTGDLFQFHPDIFYVYEPLLYLWDYYVPSKQHVTLDLQKRVKSFWKKRKAYIPSPIEFINYMFHCNLTAYNLDFLTNTAHSHHFKESNCPLLKNGMNLINTSHHCINEIVSRCKKSKGVVLKVVRLTTAEADKILELDSDVKVIHVVRDPRGILLSRMHFNKKARGEMHKNYFNICNRILDDLKVSKQLTKKHFGRILTVRYEDLAQDLPQVTEAMHKFVGLTMVPEVKQHIGEITSSDGLKSLGAKSTNRIQPYQTAYKWRDTLSFSKVRKIENACQEVFNLMGYLTFSSVEELRNQSVPAKTSIYGNGLMTLSLR